jgi:phosphate acetyltransferase
MSLTPMTAFPLRFAPPIFVHPRLDMLQERARACGKLRVGVVYPCEEGALGAALDASEQGFIDPVLIGPSALIRRIAADLGKDLGGIEIVEAVDARSAARSAVAMAAAGVVGALMKGSLHTDEMLGAVVGRESPLRTGRRASHVFWFDCPNYHKPLMLTDAVVNIAPGLMEKADIVRNAIDLAHGLGIPNPKVAILAAVETVNPALPSTIDAAALCKMADRGQITGATLDGPLGFDNAVSLDSASTKGIVSLVAGEPDILVVPSLDAGNSLYKSLVYLGGAACAGLVLGARIPIILTSRADSRQSRVASCALAALTVQQFGV